MQQQVCLDCVKMVFPFPQSAVTLVERELRCGSLGLKSSLAAVATAT